MNQSASAEIAEASHQSIATAWGAAFACAVGTMVSYTPIIVLTFPIFLKPISAEFGWGRATLSGVLLIAGIVGALASPFVGRAVDRWGARAVVLPGCLLFGLAVMSLSLIKQSPLLLYGIFIVLGIVHVAPGPIAYNKVVSAWFHERRGLALGIAIGAAMSIGNGSAPQIARLLIAEDGWRQTYVWLGLIVLCGFPVMWLLLREPARSTAAMRHERKPAVDEEGMNCSAVLRTANFWLIMGIVFFFWLAVNGFRVHIVALFTDRGRTSLLASSVLSVWSIGAFLGHIVIGYALDRVSTPRVTIPFFVCTLAGLLLLDYGAANIAVFSGAALIGLGMGAEVTLAPYLIARFFGLRAAAEVYAYITICTGIAGAMGPYLMGLTFDAFHSYRIGLNFAALALAACIVMTALLSPYAYAVRTPR